MSCHCLRGPLWAHHLSRLLVLVCCSLALSFTLALFTTSTFAFPFAVAFSPQLTRPLMDCGVVAFSPRLKLSSLFDAVKGRGVLAFSPGLVSCFTVSVCNVTVVTRLTFVTRNPRL